MKCRLIQKTICLLCSIVIISTISFSQEISKEEKKAKRNARRQEKIDKGKLMITPLAGPAYTPELKFTLALGIMLTFKTNPKDTLIQRSSSPIMAGITTTGAYFIGTKLSTFWLKDKIRIYADINYKNMPDNYWGVGYEKGYTTKKGKSTTAYNRTWFQLLPIFLWQFKKNLFFGPLLDINYTKGRYACDSVASDYYYNKYNNKPFNGGVGLVFQYDTRDIPVNARSGIFIELSSGFYGNWLAGNNTYQIYVADIRKYFTIKREGRTMALQFKSRFGFGDVPYGEMSQPGTPFDLRGYIWGQYRDKSMVIFLSEYRHQFYKKEGKLSAHGLVGWVGVGTLGNKPSDFGDWLPSIGIGYRLQVQPRMNIRLDFGIGRESQGFYLNFNEAY
ncbi:MAG: BamA/TamA family outer membrane protein [Bacteroidales bacterium]|nr:BamA/TamA family outer membrane protein [Bacteroidales bacterium]